MSEATTGASFLSQAAGEGAPPKADAPMGPAGGSSSSRHGSASDLTSSLLQQPLSSSLLQGVQQPQPNLLNQAIQQARYAMLLQAAGTLEQQVTASANPLAGLATLSQHLANQNAFPSGKSAASSLSGISAMNTTAQLLATHSAVSALTATHQHYAGGQTLASLGKIPKPVGAEPTEACCRQSLARILYTYRFLFLAQQKTRSTFSTN